MLKTTSLLLIIGNIRQQPQAFRINIFEQQYYIFSHFFWTFTEMCMCSPSSANILGVDENSKLRFKQALPKLREQWDEQRKKHQMERVNWQAESLIKNADLIFCNGTIYTLEDDYPIVDSIAIVKDRVVRVGSQEDLTKLKGPNTKIIDLKRRTMLPGFIDPHIHMAFSSIKHWVQLSPFNHRNMDEVYNTLVSTVNKCEEGSWALFQLFDPMITTGVLDVRMKALDLISTTKAIFIMQANGHVAFANSYAFKLVNVTKDSEDPPYGRFMRDSHGQLTGQLQEKAIEFFHRKIPKVSGEEYLNNFQKFLSHASSKGCTTLHDCGIGITGAQSDLCLLFDVFKDPAPVRYSGYLVSTLWDEWMQMKMTPDNKDSILRINGVKCWIDGSTQAGSALLKEPYLKAEWGYGAANYQQSKLNSAVLEAHKKGFQVGIHANGDAGIDMALDAFESVQKHEKKHYLRHRIEHCTVCHRPQLQRMKQLAVSPSFLIGHVYFYGAAFRDRILGEKRANCIDPMKSALECGLVPTVHSDYNCQPVDPLRCIYNASTRIMRQNLEVLNEKECISPYEAVKSITINAAWQCHMEDIVGSLKPGKFADFVILEQDPMKVLQTSIMDIKIWQTWKGGEKWYQG